MDALILWNEWIGIIQPYYYKRETGNKPFPLETMLLIHMLQNLYDLSDMGAKYEVIDNRAFSKFCGVDQDTGLVHHLEVTAATVHDVTVTPRLLTGEKKNIYGDSRYLGAEKREDAVTHNNEGKKIRYKINHRPSQGINNFLRSQGQINRREREKSSVRAKVEQVFGVVKGLFGYRKTRYKGRRKQAAKLHMMFALANLCLADKRCLTA